MTERLLFRNYFDVIRARIFKNLAYLVGSKRTAAWPNQRMIGAGKGVLHIKGVEIQLECGECANLTLDVVERGNRTTTNIV